MESKNKIVDLYEDDPGAKVSTIDANRTLIIDQYTSDATDEPDFFAKATTMKDVFEHFKPRVDVNFEDEEGNEIPETLKFNKLSDFNAEGGKGNLVSNSEFLSDIKIHADNTVKVRKQMEQNAKLRAIIKDDAAREDLKAMLQDILNQLENKN